MTLTTLHHTNSMSAISQLLVARFWPNFKGRFLGTSRTDSNCYGDICTVNICPGDICPDQEYLSCNWPDFDQTFLNKFFFLGRNIIWPNHFGQKYFWTKPFWSKIFIDPKIFWQTIYQPKFFFTNNLLGLMEPKNIETLNLWRT